MSAHFTIKPGKPQAAPLQHRCRQCGGPASYGYDVALRDGLLGRWYCRDHRPAESGAVAHERRPVGKQGELL
jgi:hypothetical protein